jgi:cation:H+ antiporter
VPVLVGSAIAVPILFRNGVLSELEGALLVGCAIIFTIVTLTVSARLDPDAAIADDEPEPSATSSASMSRAQTAQESGSSIGGRGRPRASRGIAALMSLVGLVLLVTGSSLFVRGGRGIAAEAGMSERMLGLTVISIGCALPELIGSLVAAARGHAALAVGSVIGSNLLNVFLVLGVTAYLGPIRLGERMHVVDLVGLVAITLLGVLTLRGSRKITRLEGGFLVAAYVAFIVCAALF